jgi:hypothetical protein
MDKHILVDLFAEDRAHEEFLLALLYRLASEHNKVIQVSVRSSRGGHGRALTELALYQKSVIRQVSNLSMPDLLVVAIDANCQRLNAARRNIQETLELAFQDRTAIACPDPHIERWYLADLVAFSRVVGVAPKVGRQKCERDRYKTILSQAVAEAGHVSMLGGIEFAKEIVDAMDLYHAAKSQRSLKFFLDEASAHLNRL